jgi:hypothetical protein
MNTIEYECKDCHYFEAIHGMKGLDYRQEQFKKCSHCTRPTRERLEGHGIYKEKKHGLEKSY